MLFADDCSCSAESSFSWLFLLLLSSLSLTARLERTRTPSQPADETPLGKTTPVKDITAMEEEPEGGMGSSTSRRLLSPRRPSATVSAATEESLEVESGAPHTTSVSGLQRHLYDEDDSSTVKPWTMLAWRCGFTLALVLLLMFLIVSGMVWAVKQVAFQKGRATDVSIVSSLSRSVFTSVEVTLAEPDPNHTRSTQDVVTTETTTPTTTTEETTTTPTTTKAASVITTTTTTTSATTTPTTTTTPATTTMSTTTRKTTAKTTTTTASGDSKTSITADPLIGDCLGRGRIFQFCERTIPGAYRDSSTNRCYDVKDENLYLCNDGPNRFATVDDCRKECLTREPPQRRCSVAPNLAPCRSKHLKRTWWFYDKRKCAEWTHGEGKCPDIEERVPEYSTESECMANCNKDSPSEGCYSTGSNKPCPVSLMKEPYFAFRSEYGHMECYVADVPTMSEHRCIDEYRRFTNLDDCFERCVVQRAIQALPPLFQPMRFRTKDTAWRTNVTKPASEALH